MWYVIYKIKIKNYKLLYVWQCRLIYQSLIYLVVIGAEFGKDDHGLISRSGGSWNHLMPELIPEPD
jgi:hypothetical protein